MGQQLLAHFLQGERHIVAQGGGEPLEGSGELFGHAVELATLAGVHCQGAGEAGKAYLRIGYLLLHLIEADALQVGDELTNRHTGTLEGFGHLIRHAGIECLGIKRSEVVQVATGSGGDVTQLLDNTHSLLSGKRGHGEEGLGRLGDALHLKGSLGGVVLELLHEVQRGGLAAEHDFEGEGEALGGSGRVDDSLGHAAQRGDCATDSPADHAHGAERPAETGELGGDGVGERVGILLDVLHRSGEGTAVGSDFDVCVCL